MKNIIYQDEKGIIVQSMPSFMGACFIIHDAINKKNVEIMAMQFKAMMHRVETTNRDYGTFPHGGFHISDQKEVTIYHDEDRLKHEVTLSFEDLKKIAESTASI